MTLAAAVWVIPLAAPATAPALSCSSTHWIGAWTSDPSNGAQGLSLTGLLDAGLNLITPVNNETIRADLTPSYGGSELRVHLSNQYGSVPVTFDSVTIGLAGAAGSLNGPAMPLTFGGQFSITLAPGQDAVSDPANFSFSALQTLAVSMFVANNPGIASQHYIALQTSFLSGSGSGDHSQDTSGAAFVQQTVTRPYVDGLDVMAPADAGAVVALGDSLTDGYQPGPLAINESPAIVDVNGRYTDDLARRLLGAAIPLSVLNAGISGNRVEDPSGGSGIDGAPAVDRISSDVLAQAGVTTVIWEEGLNDINTSPNATADQLEAAYTQGIAAMHAAGLKVLQGTLTPSPGTAATEAVREQVNNWIRTASPADGVIDFDAAVRDPNNPNALNPAFNGGDSEHLDLAGYQALANAVPLSLLRTATCTPAGMRLAVVPGRVRAGARIALRFQVTAPASGHADPVSRAVIVFDRHRVRTGARGQASITLSFAHSGRVRVSATAGGYRVAVATIDVTASPRHRKR